MEITTEIRFREQQQYEDFVWYVAGFFDGEGTVVVDSSYSLDIQVSNTYLPILVKFQKWFGGKVYKRDMEKREKWSKEREGDGYKRKQQWIWSLTDRKEQLRFLKVIESCLDEKRMQVILAIRFIEEGYFGQGTKRSKLEIKKREWFRNELQRLKTIQLTKEEINVYEKVIREYRRDKNQRTLEEGIYERTSRDKV